MHLLDRNFNFSPTYYYILHICIYIHLLAHSHKFIRYKNYVKLNKISYSIKKPMPYNKSKRNRIPCNKYNAAFVFSIVLLCIFHAKINISFLLHTKDDDMKIVCKCVLSEALTESQSSLPVSMIGMYYCMEVIHCPSDKLATRI